MNTDLLTAVPDPTECWIVKLANHFFPRKIWTIISQRGLYEDDANTLRVGTLYVLQDQFGNIKKKRA